MFMSNAEVRVGGESKTDFRLINMLNNRDSAYRLVAKEKIIPNNFPYKTTSNNKNKNGIYYIYKDGIEDLHTGMVELYRVCASIYGVECIYKEDLVGKDKKKLNPRWRPTAFEIAGRPTTIGNYLDAVRRDTAIQYNDANDDNDEPLANTVNPVEDE